MRLKPIRVGVYVDASNIAMNGGYGMQYHVLRDFACREGAIPIRLNAYLSYDPKRAETDFDYRKKQQAYHERLRICGFKVIIKKTKWFKDTDTGDMIGKSNVDLDLAVDALLQSENLDRIILATGDGDFARLVDALQNKGSRVEAIAFNNVSASLKNKVDYFMSGYLIPDLVGQQTDSGERLKWGTLDGYARGYVTNVNREKKYAFIRYMKKVDGDIFNIQSYHEESIYDQIYMPFSSLPSYVKPETLYTNSIVEFLIKKDPSETMKEQGKMRAENVKIIKS